MRKKITSLKTLLIAAGLCMGSSVWAAVGDVTTNANIDFSNAITNGVVTGTVNSMTIGGESYIDTDNWLRLKETGDCVITIPEAQRAKSKDIVNVQFKMGWGNKNGMGSGFSFKDADGETIVNFTYARWGGGSNTINIDMTGLLGAADKNAPIKARYTLFDITVNYAARTITSVVECVNTDGKGTHRTETFTQSLTNTNPIATFNAWGYNVGGNTDRADAMDDILIQTTEGDYSVVTYDYTVNWVCDGTTVKSAIRQGESGASISLFDTDKDAFTESSQKYFYVSDDASGKTVATNGSTVVTVTVRKAETWTYTVNAVDASNNVLKALSVNSVVEGETANYGYPQYIAIDGTLYTSAKQGSNPWWGKSFTPTQNNEFQTVSYSLVENGTNIVFCEEAENIVGLTVVDGGNTDIRASNRQGAYAGVDVVATTLPAGKYIVYGATYGNAGTTFTIKAGETTVLTIATNGNPVHTTGEEFTLTEGTDIVIAQAGNGGTSPKVLDYLYIQKTADVLVSTEQLQGYKTFYNATKSFEVDANTTIYKAAQVSGDKVVITAVEGKIIPAGEAVILKTTDAGYAITLTETTTASAGDFTGNALQAATSKGAIAGAYILAYTTADGFGFYQFTGSLDAGDVYVTAAGAAKLRVSVEGDDATGIKAIATEEVKDNVIYNLSGQRVVKPLKGIYIQNGKKILVK